MIVTVLGHSSNELGMSQKTIRYCQPTSTKGPDCPVVFVSPLDETILVGTRQADWSPFSCSSFSPLLKFPTKISRVGIVLMSL